MPRNAPTDGGIELTIREMPPKNAPRIGGFGWTQWNAYGLIIAEYGEFPDHVQTNTNIMGWKIGAGSGNRTRLASLEG